MIIYKISNKINNKCYIGQTVHKKFNSRYSGGKWWYNTDNQLLINAHAKYGKENFQVEILEQNVINLETLNKLEEFYAEKFNCYAPNGYNLRKCGNNRKLLPHQIELIKKCKSKTYYLRKIDTWEIIKIINLAEFSRENKLDDGALHNMMNKRQGVIASQGYCLPERTKQEVQERKMRKFKKRIFKIIDKDGNLIEIKNIKDFIKENNLEKGSFYKLLNGKMLHYHGYRLPERQNENSNNVIYFELKSPSGEIYKGYNISKFAQEHNLDGGVLGKVLRKECWQYKGWTNPNVSKEDFQFKGRKNKNNITLISPEGKEIYVDNLYIFCLNNNFDYQLFYNLYKGYNLTACGWTTKENLSKIKITELIDPTGNEIKLIGSKAIRPFCIKNNLNYNCFINMISGKVGQYKGWRNKNTKFKYK
jgi:group I intron endonuclease